MHIILIVIHEIIKHIQSYKFVDPESYYPKTLASMNNEIVIVKPSKHLGILLAVVDNYFHVFCYKILHLKPIFGIFLNVMWYCWGPQTSCPLMKPSQNHCASYILLGTQELHASPSFGIQTMIVHS